MLCVNLVIYLQFDISSSTDHMQNKYSVAVHFSYEISVISYQTEKIFICPANLWIMSVKQLQTNL